MIGALLGNLVVAGGLGLLAALVARTGRHPAWVHGLCVLALVKLITPPVWQVPVLPAAMPEHEAALRAERELQALLAAASAQGVEALVVNAPLEPPISAAAVPIGPDDGSVPPWIVMLIGGWLLGSGAVLTLAANRVRTFRRLLRHAQPADPGLCAELLRIAGHLGVRRIPEILVVDARLPPLLTPLGRRLCLLLPARLVAGQSNEARRTLLAHELAHVRRRDHLVRLLEVVVTAAWWWLPLVWWLRRMLREAEEQCCDQWVVWALPERARCYADALVDTAAFLSGPRAALPPLASGAIRTRLLEERLKMILSHHAPRRPARGLIPLALLAAASLPILPGRAQEPSDAQRARLDAALQRIETLEARLRELVDAMRRTSPGADPIATDVAPDPAAPADRPSPAEPPTETGAEPPINVAEAPDQILHHLLAQRIRNDLERAQVDNNAADRRALEALLQHYRGAERGYVVQPGDSATSIARRHYGTGDHARALLELNGIRDANRLRVGAHLRLPAAQDLPPAPADPADPDRSAPPPPATDSPADPFVRDDVDSDLEQRRRRHVEYVRDLLHTQGYGQRSDVAPDAGPGNDQELSELRAQVQALQEQVDELRRELREARRDSPSQDRSSGSANASPSGVR